MKTRFKLRLFHSFIDNFFIKKVKNILAAACHHLVASLNTLHWTYMGRNKLTVSIEPLLLLGIIISFLSELPMVCIVVEGGPNTIQQAFEAVENGFPVIVVDESGRAADVMALAFDG